MAWWSTVHPGEVLVVIAASEPYTRVEGLYRDAVRRLTMGDFRSFSVADCQVGVWMCSIERILPGPPVPTWVLSGVPRRLGETFAKSKSFPLERLRIGEDETGTAINMVVPQFTVTRAGLVVPAVGALTLGEEWSGLFPGAALAEAILLREDLRKAQAIRFSQKAQYQWQVETRSRERTQGIQVPNQLPKWDLLAAEDEEDALARAKETFGLQASSWQSLRTSSEFLKATAIPMRAVVALGWQGVMWLQLAAAVQRHCQYDDCLKPVGRGLKRYCGVDHQRLHGQEQGRQRAAEHRARRRVNKDGAGRARDGTT